MSYYLIEGQEPTPTPMPLPSENECTGIVTTNCKNISKEDCENYHLSTIQGTNYQCGLVNDICSINSDKKCSSISIK